MSNLFEAYHKDLGGKDAGVPKSTLETATPLHDSAAKEAAPGPAEAASGHVPAAVSVSAALIDSSHTGSLKVQQVRTIVHKHEGMLQSEHSAAAKAMQQVQKIVDGHKAVI